MRKSKWKETITCLKLAKYGMNAKMCFGTMILFMVIGIAFEMMTVLGAGGIFMNLTLDFGALFLYSAAMYPAQVLMSLDVSGMVQASPYKRLIQTNVMSFASFCGNMVALLLLILVRCLGATIMPERADLIWATLPIVGITGLGLSIMGALMYKYYVLSIVVLAVVFGTLGGMVGYQGSTGTAEQAGIFSGMSLPVSVVFCIAMILLGNILQYLLTRALYKRPFSKGVFGSAAAKKFV